MKFNTFLPQYVGVTGTVYYIVKTKVCLKFRGLPMLWSFNPTILRKLNKYSVNQFVRIRSDPITVMQMKKGEKEEEENGVKYGKVFLKFFSKFFTNFKLNLQ